MRRVWGALLVAAAVLVGGCSDGGQAAAPVEPSGIELPPRPRDVRIDGVDPCSLLTEEQRTRLGLDRPPVFDLGPSLLYPGADIPACLIQGYEPRAVSVGLSIVTIAGIELFTSGGLAAAVRPVQTHGFPAVVAVPTRFTSYCTVVVDVAPGQLLDVQFADGGRQPPIPQPQLCQNAEQTADAVMETLLASR
ncbi:DUF3558 domain-containing protein [Pseudonocardia sp. CA-142604]|uniref:DUF3558 domain-containing protein n=1 Tax=Pseudonocardia sp. CA-142604 TaxID=3240024 RepID=UPI003D90450F